MMFGDDVKMNFWTYRCVQLYCMTRTHLKYIKLRVHSKCYSNLLLYPDVNDAKRLWKITILMGLDIGYVPTYNACEE